MTVFSYKATDKNGKFVEGNIDADDYRMDVQRIRKLQYFPIQVQEGKGKNGLTSGTTMSVPNFLNQIPQKELMSVTHQLATLVDSGLTLDRSLSIRRRLARHRRTDDRAEAIPDSRRSSIGSAPSAIAGVE